MTPTEQDKELREKLYSIFEIDCDYYSPTVQNGCGYDGFYCNLHTSMLDNAMQLITADRKRVALEARLDELQKVDMLTKPSLPNSGSVEANVKAWVKDRLPQLKAQQEGL